MNEAEELSNLTTMAFKEGFQKGKLEAEEKNCGKSINEAIINRRKLDLREELEFLKEFYNRFGKVWEGCCSINGLRRQEANEVILNKIEQLQKVIGGNSNE